MAREIYLRVRKPVPKVMSVNLTNLVLPARHAVVPVSCKKTKIAAIIPTYKPGVLTFRLVCDLLRWNPALLVYLVDDCTPASHTESVEIFRRIACASRRVTLLRTPVNKLKAGALNFALSHIAALGEGEHPEVILTLDDDVVVDRHTVRNLVAEMINHPNVAAICSQCRVFNKNKNLLTRLQGLEYLGFNAVRMADDGCLRGPLVMHGMLTAFRAEALVQVGGFVDQHLIEDYEITTRLKACGWDVKAASNSSAWTMVPETFAALWWQRARWSYGGITVILGAKKLFAVLQDVMGHILFLSTLAMIVFLLVAPGNGNVSMEMIRLIVVLSMAQLLVWYVFQLWLMHLYKEKDRYDWLLKLSILPEFIYSNILTLVFIGSYLFLLFTAVAHALVRRHAAAGRLIRPLARAFSACGYTKNWASRMHDYA